MVNDIRLFIGGKEVEFSQDPRILVNYKLTDLTNPTIVHNSYTKQIQLEGTKVNNDIFGHIWNLERTQDYMTFNPILKADFQLFVKDNLFQKGYVKLDKVTTTNNTVQYSITLFGGLGQFFYNLSSFEESNKKKTLADLYYSEGTGYNEPDLNFKINMGTVNTAWGKIAGYGSSTDDKWNVINFMPCYNGYPQDFDARSVLINLNQMTGEDGFNKSFTDESGTYMGVLNNILSSDGYALGDMEEELTEWETRDLRSYLQRPVIRMQRIIKACQNPQNNGGWEVKLDNHFFHSENPYYHNAWITLPMLKDLDGAGEGKSYTLTSAQISTSTTQAYGADIHSITYNTPSSLVSINNVRMKVSVRFTPDSTTSADNLYPYHEYHSRGTALQGRTYVRDLASNGGVIMQMIAYGSNGEVAAQSDAYFLGANTNYPGYYEQMWSMFFREDGDLGVKPDFNYMEGYWKKVGNNYVFVDNNGNQVDIEFSFQAPVDYSSLVLKVKTPYGYYCKYMFSGSQGIKEESHTGSVPLYTSRTIYTSDRESLTTVLQKDRVMGNYNFVVTSMEGTANEYSGLFTNTQITKDKLLTTERTPADYLISYCKLFGLYFYYDPSEESSDPVQYPQGVIHIMDRDTFYTDEYVDLSQLIDWNKKMEITPALATSKYYNFDVEYNESEVGEEYKQQYGKVYGSQLVNTNYNFDNNTTELYTGNVFKNGIMVLEKDKYMKRTGNGLPVYQYNGLSYSLFRRPSGNDEFEAHSFDFPVQTLLFQSPINTEYENFDTFPKLQLHEDNNNPNDGRDILVFFRNGVNVNCDYYLTDDTPEMATLNNGSPCWLMTKTEYDGNGGRIAYKLNRLPLFTRDLILTDIYGDIVHSWNFGQPQVTYSPDTYSTPNDSIYDKCWRKYINDMYNQNTRKLICYARMNYDGKPWAYWLRRFYWFENSIWRLNEIRDLNLGSSDTTRLEFIKVIDVDNYKLNRINYQGENYLVLYNNSVPCSGGTISGKVVLQSSQSTWRATDNLLGYDAFGNAHYHISEDIMSPWRGTGTTNFTINIPESEANSPITWYIRVRDDYQTLKPFGYVRQEECISENFLELSGDTVPCSGGSLSGAMHMLTSESWVADDIFGTDASGVTHTLDKTVVMIPYSGVGETTTPFVLNIPENNYGADVSWNLSTRDTRNMQYNSSFFQPYCPPGESYLEVSGDTVACSGGSIQGFMHMGTAANWIADNLWCEDLSGVTHYLTKEDHIIPYSGLGETTTPFIMTVPANTLSATMVWNIDINDTSGNSYSSTFYQPYCEPVPIPSYLEVVPESASALSSGRTLIFNVNCSGGTVQGATATTNVNWLTPSLNATYNPTALTVVVAANNTFSARSATVTVAGTGTQGPVSDSVTITQNGKIAVAISPSTINVNKESGVVYYNYYVTGGTPGVDGIGHISATGNWNNVSGVLNQQIESTYSTNNTSGSRTSTISYTFTHTNGEQANATARLIQSNQATVVPIVTNKDNLVLDYPASRTDSVILTTASGWTSTIIDN